jgi:hypothetical protein
VSADRPRDPVDPERQAEVDATRRHLAALAWLLDSAFPVPGTRHSFGIGPLLGVIPVVGDLAGAVAGGYLVLRAMRVGLPRVVILRMAANVLLDAAIGVVPLAGDAFDFVFKPNERNFRLFEQHALDPRRGTAGSWVFLGALVGVVVLVLVGIVLVAVAVLQAILELF